MAAAATENKKQFNIILADDDEEDKKLFEEALAETNILAKLATVSTGPQLMEKLRIPGAIPPDVIFLNIYLPLKDAKECIAEIKNDDRLKNIPCVIYSASDHAKVIEETYQAGANLYVTKQVSFRNLFNVLKKVIVLNWKEYKPKPLRQKFFVSEK